MEITLTPKQWERVLGALEHTIAVAEAIGAGDYVEEDKITASDIRNQLDK